MQTTPAAPSAAAPALSPEQQADIDALLRLDRQVHVLIETNAKLRADAETKLVKDLSTGDAAAQLPPVLSRLRTWETFGAQSDADKKSLDALAALVRQRRDRLALDTPDLARAYYLKKLASLRADRQREQADVTKVDTDIREVEALLSKLGCDLKAAAS